MSVTDVGVKCHLVKDDGKVEKFHICGADPETFVRYHELEKQL